MLKEQQEKEEEKEKWLGAVEHTGELKIEDILKFWFSLEYPALDLVCKL